MNSPVIELTEKGIVIIYEEPVRDTCNIINVTTDVVIIPTTVSHVNMMNCVIGTVRKDND